MQLKLKSFFNAMAFCMSLAWKTSKHYTIGRCTLLILSTCTPYISMFLNKILIDSLTIINEKNYFSILFILILVMLMAIITKLFSKLSAYYQNIHSDLLEHEIEKMVMKKTMKTNIEFYDSPEYLNTLQAVMTDFFSLNEITWNIFYGMSGICSLIIAAGMIGRYQWSYAIVLLIFSIPSAVLNQKFSKKAYKLRLNNMPYERQQSYMYSVASDRYFAFDIRLHNLCDFFMNRYKKFWSICFKDRKQLKKKQLICIFPTYVIPEIIIFLFMSRIVKSILNGDSSVGDFSLYIGLFTSLIAARHLVQDTQRYSMLLHTSYNPDFLQDAKDRQLFLCAVLKNVEQMQGNMEIAKLEIKDMLNMDIPYFYSNTSKEDLYGSEGEVVKNYFAESSIQHLRNKICSMGKKDREEQIRFIKIILTDLNDVKVEKPKKDINELCISRSDNEHGQKEYKKNAILKILHTLEQKAFYGDDGQDINWIGITSIGNSENSSWNIQPLGVYLYEGLGGIALFYNALQQSDFDVDLSAACKAFETMMFQYTDDMLERSTDLEKESSGAYAGEASVIYVYEVLYKITGKQKYLEYAEKHCKILEYALKADENNDLIYGNAGAVIVLLNLYHLAQKDIYLQLACEAGNILIKNQNKGKWCCGNGQSLSGLSHGITGIIYALTKLNNEQFHIEYQKAIHSGLIYENTMYSDKYNNWLDNREEAKKEENSDNRCMAAWCHGAPGILLARSKMYNLVKDSSDYITVQCDIERALFATKMYGFTDNDCLCHGNLGNTEILLEYSKECNDEEVRHMMLSARTQIAMDIINENYDCARSYLHGYKIPGFMTGISGMGYSLLRDLYPELPCILALEI